MGIYHALFDKTISWTQTKAKDVLHNIRMSSDEKDESGRRKHAVALGKSLHFRLTQVDANKASQCSLNNVNTQQMTRHGF